MPKQRSRHGKAKPRRRRRGKSAASPYNAETATITQSKSKSNASKFDRLEDRGRESHSEREQDRKRPDILWKSLIASVVVMFVWSYWTVFTGLVSDWRRIEDYSHGFLVIPLALLFLWLARDKFPGWSYRIAWGGALLIGVSAVLRFIGAYYYLDTLQGWSIPFWVAGFVWMFCGWRVFLWSLPSIAFLVFMVPLPYVVEHMLSQPLQLVSTQISLFLLQCLGQPAVAQGTTILLDSHILEVERACSGLRIFLGIAALAYAFMVCFKRPLWNRLLMVMLILPIAILANSLRIVGTGLLLQLDLTKSGAVFVHDLAGFLMIPIAAAMFALIIKYLDILFPELRSVDTETLIRSQSRRKPGVDLSP